MLRVAGLSGFSGLYRLTDRSKDSSLPFNVAPGYSLTC